MQPMSGLDVLVNCVAGFGFLGFLTFVIVYGVRSNWRATPAGRSLMYAISSLNLITLMATVHLFTGRYPGIEFVRIVAYTVLAVSAWRLVWTLHNILRSGDRVIEQFYPTREDT